MTEWLRAFLDTRLLNPHGICLLWRPELLWTHAVSDGLIGLSYFSIPFAFALYLRRRPDLRFSWAAWMVSAVFLLCGLTHFMSVWTLWRPDYGIEAMVKASAAAMSLATAVALWPLLPRLLALPSSAALEARVRERDAAVEKLTAAMETMVAMEEHQAQQQSLLDEIQEKEARLRSVFDNAAVGIARGGLGGQYVEVNARYAQIAGRSREEMLAGGFQSITHPDDLARDFTAMQAMVRGETSNYVTEKRYVRSGGEVVWVKLTSSIVRNADGRPDHFIAIVEDITEAKHGDETRTLLMREVDHRARNALAVVQSIVRLTEASDPAQYKERVIGRVDALARAQGSLARRSWQGALLEDVLRQELSSAAAPERLELDGPEQMLCPEAVQPLSMLVHELATNAAKYGALSTPGGRVVVEWDAQPDGAVSLCWTEHGGPAVTPPERAGFGSRLITRLAAQLRAEASFEWGQDGLRFRLVRRSAETSA
jgi:PAS domain S-box-containing protein